MEKSLLRFNDWNYWWVFRINIFFLVLQMWKQPILDFIECCEIFLGVCQWCTLDESDVFHDAVEAILDRHMRNQEIKSTSVDVNSGSLWLIISLDRQTWNQSIYHEFRFIWIEEVKVIMYLHSSFHFVFICFLLFIFSEHNFSVDNLDGVVWNEDSMFVP